jgi:hypothetical protein
MQVGTFEEVNMPIATFDVTLYDPGIADLTHNLDPEPVHVVKDVSVGLFDLGLSEEELLLAHEVIQTAIAKDGWANRYTHYYAVGVLNVRGTEVPMHISGTTSGYVVEVDNEGVPLELTSDVDGSESVFFLQ